jgi:soluble lytic murein transglycosylase-like protein
MGEIRAKMEAVFGKQGYAGDSGFAVVAAGSGLSGTITPNGTLPAAGGFAPVGLGGDITVDGAGKTPPHIKILIEKAAQDNNVDSKLLDALIQAESDYKPDTRSSAGAMGLAQLMPDTAKSLGITNPFDPYQSVNGGAKYLRQMLDKFGSVELALAAYNAGPGAVNRHGGIPPYRETQNYVKKIMALYKGASQ